MLLLAGSSAGRAETPGLPDSCSLDFSATLERPAGRRGFLRVGSNGRFVWNDGTRARFWGINVSSTRLDIPKEQIEQVVGRFARAGINLVRLEAIDNRNCLLGSVDAPTSREFDPRYLDRIDYWMHTLRRHGIYYYLDLLDLRTFKEGDGVLRAAQLDRGARPYAVFDPYLIQLQKEYATKLLTHKNPYSGLRPVDDPALALVEICNEHGFFLYPEKLDALLEPYRSNLQALWNRWLREQYPTRDRLAAAWGEQNGWKALRPEEDPENNTVVLPRLTRSPTLTPVNANVPPDMRLSPARLRDGVAFLAGLQRAYFREMRAHVRALGLRVPVTAVVSNHILPDVASVAQECDFTSENWYGDNLTTDPRAPGIRYYANRNPLRDTSTGGFAPFTAALRWNQKPVVIREWAVSWPNRYRAASVPEVLAYASLQDYDAALLFGYQTNRAPNGAEADALNDFAFQSDPTVWGLYALAGQAFLGRALRPAAQSLTLGYPDAERFRGPNGIGDLHRLAYRLRVGSVTDSSHVRRESGGLFVPNANAPPVNVQRLKTSLDAPVWRSDTGEIARYYREGRLEVRAPRLRMLAGELTPGRVYDLGGGLRFSTPTPVGALLLLSLDGQPVERSRRFVVKMVSRAENTGEEFVREPLEGAGTWALKQPGAAPVRDFGRASSRPTRLWIEPSRTAAAPRNLLTLWMTDGTWELRVENGQKTLRCDTPGIVSKRD